MKAETTINPIKKIARAENRAPRWVLPSVRLTIFAIDGFLAFFCFALAFVIRDGGEVFSKTAFAWSKEFVPYAGVVFFTIPVRLAMLSYQRVYRMQGAFSFIAEFIKIFKAVSIGSLLMIAFTFLFRGGFAFRDFSYSRGVFALDFVIALFVYSLFHLGLRILQTKFRSREINLIPTLIVGTNAEAVQTIREIRERRDLGYRIVGVVESDGVKPKSWDAELDEIIAGNFEDLSEIIRELEIQEVIITDNKIPSEKLFEAMMQVGRKRKVEFRLAPSLFNFLPQKTSVEQIGVLPMVQAFSRTAFRYRTIH